MPGLFLSHFNLSIRGNNNCICFRPGGISYIRGLRISITGDNNTIEIGQIQVVMALSYVSKIMALKCCWEIDFAVVRILN